MVVLGQHRLMLEEYQLVLALGEYRRQLQVRQLEQKLVR